MILKGVSSRLGMRSRVLLFGLVAVLTLSATSASASWTRAGLFGADVRALVIDPADPDTLFLGTSHGEVYISTDAAQSWTNTYAGVPFPGYVVDNLSVDERGRLWAASWGLWGGGVIAVSEDRGKTWKRRDAGLEKFSVRALVVDSCNADHIVAGGLTGVFRSLDGGENWTQISTKENVESLAIDPRSADRIYMGTWRQAWRTDDGGQTWKHINDGMVLDTDVFAIRIDPRNPDNVWMSTCGWVYNSSDAGDTWTRFRDGFNNRRIHDIAFDPGKPKSLLAGSVAGLYTTANNGKKWELLTDESIVINAIAVTPMRPKRVILGTEGDGVYVSNDGGKTFGRASAGLYNVRVSAISADPESEGNVYAAVLFGNAASGIYQSADAGETWQRLSKTKLPEVLSLLIQPDTDPKFLAGTEKGIYWSNDGVDWTIAEPTTLPMRADKVLRYNRLRLFAATSEGVFTSRDAGKSWYRLAEIDKRTTDIAIGTFKNARALFALTNAGVMIFDGERWAQIEGSPTRGKTLALRRTRDGEQVTVAGGLGLSTGRIGEGLEWIPVSEKNTKNATWSAPLADRGLFPSTGDWSRLWLPIDVKDVAALANDPFDEGRLFVATLGHGVFVFDREGRKKVDTVEKTKEAETPEPPDRDRVIYLSGGGSR